MRVLISSTPGTGHLLPLVPLGRALEESGHDVRWATAAESMSIVEQYGMAAEPAGMSVDARLSAFADRFPAAFELPPRERRPTMFAGHFATIAGPAMAATLPSVVDRFRPDVIVHEPAELVAPALADALGLPHVAVAFSGALPDAVVSAARDAVAPIWSMFGRSVPSDLGLTSHLYAHPFPPQFGQRPGGANVHPMRPVASPGSRRPPSWIGALGRTRPAVYATYGTEMGPRAPWSALLGGLARLDVDVVVTVGARVDPASFGPLPERFHIERYLSQDEVLEWVTLVVSHGGAGTLLGAASAGLAQLVVPLAADQWENAEAAAASGSALVVEEPTVDGVASTVQLLLDHPTYREAARAVARQLAEMPSPLDFVRRIEALV